MLFVRSAIALVAMTTVAFSSVGATLDSTDPAPVALDNVVAPEEDAYIPGTNLRRKLKSESGSGASMTFIIGYSPDRIEEDCNSIVQVPGGKQISIDDMIVGNANSLVAKAGIKKQVSKFSGNNGNANGINNKKKPILNLDSSAVATTTTDGDGNGDNDEEQRRRELGPTCPCEPHHANCEACCLCKSKFSVFCFVCFCFIYSNL